MMARRSSQDEIQLSARSLGIVFKEKKTKKVDSASSPGGSDSHNDSCGKIKAKTKTGEDFFSEFVEENKRCYWDPHLEESVKNLKYEGHLHPFTILVTGRDIYLDTVKNAWARRAIRSPCGYNVHKVGEVCRISMTTIAQTQFTPLPEALCIIISDLTAVSEDATFDTILDHLKVAYKGLQQPTEQTTYETLGNLIKERKIYHTGNGYHILSPDFYQPGSNNVVLQDNHLVIGATHTSTGVTPTLYIPIASHANQNDVRSISCQTETKALDDSLDKDDRSEKEEKSLKKNKLERGNSVKEKKNKKENFTRSASVRYGEEKTKTLQKDINLKTSDVHQDKDKGEKSSLLTKLFGRNKSKEVCAIKEEDKPEMVEHATFSAQFPPPEWNVYQSQAARVPVAPPHQTTRSNTWHHMTPAMMDPETESEEGLYDEIHATSCPVARSRTLPLETNLDQRVKGWMSSSSYTDSISSLNDTPLKLQLERSGSPHRQATPTDRHSGSMLDPDSSRSPPPDVRPKDRSLRLSDLSPQDGDIKVHRNTFDTPPVLNNAATAQSPPERPSHVTKVFKKYREMKCTSFCRNDISGEYCGKMPRKGHVISQSRDSGVNCIGVSNNGASKPQLYGKNHYNASHTPLNNYVNMEKDNTAPRPNMTVHQAEVHVPPSQASQVQASQVQASQVLSSQVATSQGSGPGWQEDSGFNSMRLVDNQDTSSPFNSPPILGASTPNNLSPSEQYHSNHTELVDSYHERYHSPDLSEDQYPSYRLTNGHHSVDHLDHEDSEEGVHVTCTSNGSMWSDTSKQTVRQVKHERRQSSPHKHKPRDNSHNPREPSYTPREPAHTPREPSYTPREPSHTPHELSHTPREASPPRLRRRDSPVEPPRRSSKHNRHSHPKSPHRSSREGDRSTRTRPGSSTGKTLANQVYESHQRRQAKTKYTVTDHPRDSRDSYPNIGNTSRDSAGDRKQSIVL